VHKRLNGESKLLRAQGVGRLAEPYVKLSAIYMWENGNTQLSE
jgi:hypothetical protein